MRVVLKREIGKAWEDFNMKKIIEFVKKRTGAWLNREDIWSYDETVRMFREEGYSWIKSQEKADIIFGVAVDPDLKKVWRSI